MKRLLLIPITFGLAAYAAAQQPAPLPKVPFQIGTLADEAQRAAAESRLNIMMADERPKQIGQTITGSDQPGYSSFNWLDTDPALPITIAATCDGECLGLKLDIRGPDGYGRGYDSGVGEAMVVVAAGHPAKLNVVPSVQKCSAPACAYAIGAYNTVATPRPHSPTNQATKRDSIAARLDAKAANDGWKRVGGISVQDLKDLKTHDFQLAIYPGVSTQIITECESGCGDVSLSAVDEKGAALSVSGVGGAAPQLNIRSDTLRVTVHATASACSANSCRFAVGAYQK